MQTQIFKYTAFILLITILIPVLVWSFVKPFRIFFPEQNGVVCINSVCVEDPKRLVQALSLYNESFNALTDVGIQIHTEPTFIYCSTKDCYRSFGGNNERAMSYPFFGTIIGPESWQGYITQHELVHWFQFNEIGTLRTMQLPEWFREGMAYSYSNAPSYDIPVHYKPMIKTYNNWHSDKTWSEVILMSQRL